MSIFTDIQLKKMPSSTFDLSHQVKFSAKIGQLIPCMIMETLPGDVFSSNTAQLVRTAPLIAPIMHQVSVYTHFFYVPNRLLWDNWEDFISGGEDGLQEPVFPTVDLGIFNNVEGSLMDYLGIPTDVATQEVNALPLAAYQLIYNEYYRDQNLIDERNYKLVDGDNSTEKDLLDLHNRAWQHDYFTSALPWTQKGPIATIPLGTEAPIVYDNDRGNTVVIDNATGAAYQPTTNPAMLVNNLGNIVGEDAPNPQLDLAVGFNHYADLSQATANTIIDLRNAFRLQEWLERNARAGSRYFEFIRAHFNVDVGDARVNRPEFLGGGTTPISFSEVLQTSGTGQTGSTTPQGNMAGHGISLGESSSWKYRCKEHGFIIGIMSIMPKTSYQDGMARFFHKKDKFDYYFHAFAHIGEQPIYNREIYQQNNSQDEEIFGYTPRYAEYKYINDRVAGKFRTSLDVWQGGRKFSSLPLLNQEFIECESSEMDRLFAVQGEEQLYIQCYHQVRARRHMPYFSTPKI